MDELEKSFRSVVKGQNGMTPQVENYYRRNNFVIELSSSDVTFSGCFIFGVTVVDEKERKYLADLSKCFIDTGRDRAKRLAFDYINSL